MTALKLLAAAIIPAKLKKEIVKLKRKLKASNDALEILKKAINIQNKKHK